MASKWFDRKFEFTFPVEQFQNLCVRLRGTPARLEEFIHSCDAQKLVRKDGESWSIQEHAGHLADLEPLWLARVIDFNSGQEVLTPADLSNRKTHEAQHNLRKADDILEEFRRGRMNLMQRLQGLDTASVSRTMLHPRLKQPMRLVDHLFFAAEHDDHHLAKMWELNLSV
jgi:uncharacterized damage-inducible protein DinB